MATKRAGNAEALGEMIMYRASITVGWMILAMTCQFSGLATAETVLFPAGATWRYLDNGSDQGVAWRTNTFNDAAWSNGPAPLGYGHAPLEHTVISYGTNSLRKYITSYFRRTFAVSNASSYTVLRLELLRDDGIVLYINGSEVLRDNMPGGPVTYQMLASTKIGAPDET
ncbi:MAG: hypothetical protein WCN95_05915, partial [bacterium]